MQINNHSKRLGIFLLLAGIYSWIPSWSVAAPAIYRCGPVGNPSYSQIPCEEDSEQVQVEDQHLFSESNVAGETTEAASVNEDRQQDELSRTPEDKLKSFITQLEKQRTEQLAEVDRNILLLEEEAQGANAAEAADATGNQALMDNLQSARQSIVNEYEAMIGEAQRRLAGH